MAILFIVVAACVSTIIWESIGAESDQESSDEMDRYIAEINR